MAEILNSPFFLVVGGGWRLEVGILEGICSNRSWDDISPPRKNGTPGDEDHDTVPALATATTATGRLTVTAETVQLNAGEEAGGWLEFRDLLDVVMLSSTYDIIFIYFRHRYITCLCNDITWIEMYGMYMYKSIYLCKYLYYVYNMWLLDQRIIRGTGLKAQHVVFGWSTEEMSARWGCQGAKQLDT